MEKELLVSVHDLKKAFGEREILSVSILIVVMLSVLSVLPVVVNLL